MKAVERAVNRMSRVTAKAWGVPVTYTYMYVLHPHTFTESLCTLLFYSTMYLGETPYQYLQRPIVLFNGWAILNRIETPYIT